MENPFEEHAFKKMSPEARDWHIMSEVYEIKASCVVCDGRISKLEKRKKFDTGVSSFFGLVGGFLSRLAG